mmetsp:Transcript_27657/g.32730  ORF Transcript_27657/g.32730 Transcript_27657/m.32730 type:complete len:541 (+) Transcript_27657:87-1709(+)
MSKENADALKELIKLKKVVDELRPLADQAKATAELLSEAEHEVVEWKRIGTEAIQEKDDAVEELEAERERATEVTRNYDQQVKDIAALEKKLETMQMNAKYDASAREGQVKRSRIIQTELEETRDENTKLETRNNELEGINKELEKSRNHERALRLQDLHRNSTMAGAKKVAELHETEMEQRAAKISEELISSRDEVIRLRSLVKAADKVAADHDLEMIRVREDLEIERNQKIRIDNQLHNTITTLEASVRAQRELEMEVSRLRGEIIMAGTEVGSKTQQMKAQPQRRRQQNRTETNSATMIVSGGYLGLSTPPSPSMPMSSARQHVNTETAAWQEQLALEAAITSNSKPLAAMDSNWRSSDTSRKDNVVNSLGAVSRTHRNGIGSRGDGNQHYFYQDSSMMKNKNKNESESMSLRHIIARPEGQEGREGLHAIANRRRRRGGGQNNKDGKEVFLGTHHDHHIKRKQHNKDNLDDDDDDDDENRSMMKNSTKHEVIHQGSLFVGSGLGLRKEHAATKSMSSREMLKNILAGRESSNESVN